MNWLKKIANMTFSVADSEKISRPKTTHTIGMDMLYWAKNNIPKNLFPNVPEPIAMDGGNTDSLTGTINWYVNPNIDQNEPIMYIKQYIREELLPLGIYATIRGLEQSNMFKPIKVWRIDITKNDTESYLNLPKLNLSNENTRVVLDMLNIDSSMNAGSINANDLLNRVLRAYDKVSAFTRSDEIGPEGRRYGIDEIYLEIILDKLFNIAEHAINMGINKVVWY